ncbi:MAG: MBL fold metallo-hydrolase [Steroidobacteraceae bacterium]|jgi:glyoxylase-like metal-dependent hydrolase (beta-lactamase superfamily II)|nr:MBL fold metallo-hydrolase [Steroidobacteraceae bacterium]
MTNLSRRHWLALAGAGAASLALPGCTAGSRTISAPAARVIPTGASGPVPASAGGPWPIDWTVGDVRITKVLDVVEPFDAARAYPGAPLEAFAANADWLPAHFYDPARKAIIFSFHSYLVRTAGLTMIVDTCWGEDTPLRARQHHGRWLENLAAAGVRPEHVDVVTCTHFHADHVGWNTRLRDGRWVPTFPRARHLFNATEIAQLEASVEAGTTPPAVYEQSVQPVLQSGHVIRLDGGYDVARGVRIVPSPGHSPGHQHVEIASRGRRAVLSGDLVHNPIEIRHPEWTKVFDQDKGAARATRTRFIESHTDVDVTLFAAHFAGPTAGRIVSSSGGRRFRPLGD